MGIPLLPVFTLLQVPGSMLMPVTLKVCCGVWLMLFNWRQSAWGKLEA